MAQWLGNQFNAAIATLEQAAKTSFPARYGNVRRVFTEEADMIHYAAHLHDGNLASKIMILNF